MMSTRCDKLRVSRLGSKLWYALKLAPIWWSSEYMYLGRSPTINFYPINSYTKWISKIKTPSPEPETGSYDTSICSPFWLKDEPNNCKVLQQWHTLYEKSNRWRIWCWNQEGMLKTWHIQKTRKFKFNPLEIDD